MGFAYACDGACASTTQHHSFSTRVAIRRVDNSSRFILSLLAFYSYIFINSSLIIASAILLLLCDHRVRIFSSDFVDADG